MSNGHRFEDAQAARLARTIAKADTLLHAATLACDKQAIEEAAGMQTASHG